VRSRIRGLQLGCALLALGLTVVLSACGSGSGQATTLLKQTFSGPHPVSSGELSVELGVDPSGSSTLKAPITVSLSGRFQSLGQGKLPASSFAIGISELGRTASLRIVSTGTNGYVTLQGTSYQLPPSSFRTLESSFGQLAGSAGGSGSGTLSRLGIDPLRWLVHPSVVGAERVGGTQTMHVRAAVNVGALLVDLNTFLQKASSVGIAGTAGIPPLGAATRTRLAAAVKNPRFDVWTGTADKTLRKVAIQLGVPVSGQISTLLGGLRAAQIGLSLQYSGLGQPQMIQAPAQVHPFKQFAAKLRSFLAGVQSLAGG
jgi:hypothetical protein